MSDDANRLDRLVESWSEGQPLDWAAADAAAAGGDERASVSALRDVARIAEFNRSLQRAPAGAGAGPERWGELLLLERIRSGASGDVFRAWEPRLERDVALKLLREDASPAGEAWVDEARAVARVAHRNVVTVHGAAEHDGRRGVWMEYLRGETLAERIERAGPLTVAEVLRVGRELGDALAAVHAAGLVHGDLKPANVVLEPDGRVVLTDFGLGRRLARPDAGAFSVSGTPMFMSPECLDGRPATPRSDQYALGVTLWFALTARYPFEARSLEDLRAALRKGPAQSLAAARPEAPQTLVLVIERAMHADETRRYPSVAAAVVALDVARERAAPPTRRAARGPAIGLRLAAAIVLVGGLAAIVIIPRLRSARPPGVAPASPPALAPSTASYDVEATFVRRTRGAYQRLASGDRVAPGDELSLEFHATRPAWVYVLNEDERGESYLLFPQPLFDRGNPVEAAAGTVLPGPIRGRENAWTVTSRGGREHFLVIASPTPVAELEAELARLPAVRPGRPVQYAAIPAPVVERLRGVGGVAPVRDSPRRAGAFERFEALAGRESGVRGVWVRRVTLENPPR